MIANQIKDLKELVETSKTIREVKFERVVKSLQSAWEMGVTYNHDASRNMTQEVDKLFEIAKELV